jgi:hypothetical protein
MPVSPKKGKIAKEGPLNPVGLFICGDKNHKKENKGVAPTFSIL